MKSYACENPEVVSTETESAVCPDCRPVVVIDPEDREAVERLVDQITRLNAPGPATYADRVQLALREFATPTPPKPEEPGLGGVVEDTKGRRWVNATDHRASVHTNPWMCLSDPERWASYADIDVAEVLSHGVTK